MSIACGLRHVEVVKLESIKREKTRKERGKDLVVMAIGVFPFVFFLVRFPLSSAEGGGGIAIFPAVCTYHGAR